MLLSCSYRTDSAIDIDLDCQVWLLLAQCRQNACQVYNVVDLVVLDHVVVLGLVGHIKSLIAARQVELLLCNICSDHLLRAQLLAKLMNVSAILLACLQNSRICHRFCQIHEYNEYSACLPAKFMIVSQILLPRLPCKSKLNVNVQARSPSAEHTIGLGGRGGSP